ncbi:MAG: UbiA family prenyltransferase [Saprospiraceae bacterium]|nr:UbiA family prenyltransferase [Candidatus Opimibacter iunctus]
MTGKFIRDIVNLLIYGGGFIGLCASCITALSFELTGQAEQNLPYIFLIGAATAALYALHRVVGLNKTVHLKTSERFSIIRKYQFHIRVYTVIWAMISLSLLASFNLSFLLLLLPGGIIAFTYVIPFLSGGRRLRDLGWAKIVMIGFSGSWLTAVIPLGYFTEASIQMIVIHGLERMLFIMLLTIPFEIRDLHLDRSVGLITIPEKLGRKRTSRIAIILCIAVISLSGLAAFQYFNLAYVIAMSLTSLLVIPLIHFSYAIEDDYFFGGLMDGLMIAVLWVFIIVNHFV